jgi:glycosyltransferase involved in cell wall biosynthesis
MRILVVCQYFPPDVTAAAFRMGETIDLLRAWGHDVQVVTATPHKSGPTTGHVDAPGVHRVAVKPLSGRGMLGYLEQYLGFALRALVASGRVRKSFDYEVIWASSPPLFVAITTLCLSLRTRRPVVFDVRDIWPDSAVGIGKLRAGSLMERLGKVLERTVYRRSAAITCVSLPMREYIVGKTDRPVEVVYNGIRTDLIPDQFPALADPDWFCYAGNLGHAQGMDIVLRAFRQALAHEAMRGAMLQVVGTGACEHDLRALAIELGIADRIVFHGVVAKPEALSMMLKSGTLVIPLIDVAAFRKTVPSKVFDCMALARPLIAAIEGEGAEIIGSQPCNIVVQPGDADAMASAFVRARTRWDAVAASASGNVDLVRSRYTREQATRILEGVLRRAIGGKQ